MLLISALKFRTDIFDFSNYTWSNFFVKWATNGYHNLKSRTSEIQKASSNYDVYFLILKTASPYVYQQFLFSIFKVYSASPIFGVEFETEERVSWLHGMSMYFTKTSVHVF